MTFGVKDSQQLWVAIVAFCRVKQRLDETLRRIFRCRRVQIKAECRKYLCRISFELVKLFVRYLAHLQLHGRKIFDIIGIVMNVHGYFVFLMVFFENIFLYVTFRNNF